TDWRLPMSHGAATEQTRWPRCLRRCRSSRFPHQDTGILVITSTPTLFRWQEEDIGVPPRPTRRNAAAQGWSAVDISIAGAGAHPHLPRRAKGGRRYSSPVDIGPRPGDQADDLQ